MKKLLKILPSVMLVCLVLTSVFAMDLEIQNQDIMMQSSLPSDAMLSMDEALSSLKNAWLLSAIFFVISVVANWKIFAKAGEPGWACIVPIYANVVQFKIVGLNPWLLLLYLIPIVNIVVAAIFVIVVPFRLAKSYGKGTAWGFGLWLLPFIFNLILAFGASTYVGPNGETRAE